MQFSVASRLGSMKHWLPQNTSDRVGQWPVLRARNSCDSKLRYSDAEVICPISAPRKSVVKLMRVKRLDRQAAIALDPELSSLEAGERQK